MNIMVGIVRDIKLGTETRHAKLRQIAARRNIDTKTNMLAMCAGNIISIKLLDVEHGTSKA